MVRASKPAGVSTPGGYVKPKNNKPMYVTPIIYRHMINDLTEELYINAGWENDRDFIKPEGDFISYYDGTGNTVHIDIDKKIFYQTDSSD